MRDLTGLHLQAVQGSNSLRSLWNAEVDVILNDAGSSIIGNVLYNLQILAVEETLNGPSSTSYSSGAWVLSTSDFTSFEQTQGQRACLGSFLSSSGTLLPTAWALSSADDSEDDPEWLAKQGLLELLTTAGAGSDSSDSNVTVGGSLHGCQSVLGEVFSEYFYATCAPG